MLHRMYQVGGWVLENPARARLVVMGLVVALMIVSVAVPGVVIRADEAVSGGH